MSATLEDLWSKGKNFLGSKYSIMGGAMSWISEHNLVSAISNAGGFGVIACSAMGPDLLKNEIVLTKNLVGNNPFGVNIIIMHPEIHDLIEVCIEEKVTHIILAGGLPKLDIIKKVKSAGVKILTFIPTVAVAKRLIKSEVDGLIIEGMEAGGHVGPVSTSVLAQEILPHFKDSSIPIFIAGGIAHGSMMVNYLNMGASGCQMGTIFVCVEESIAHDNFKEKFIKSSARDTTVSMQVDENFPVIPVRAIKNDATKDFFEFQKDIIQQYYNNSFTKEETQLRIEKYWAGALKRAVIDGDVTYGSIMAGQSVGMVNGKFTTKQIIEKLVEEARFALMSR